MDLTTTQTAELDRMMSRAWPAVHEESLGRWLLRASDNASRRVDSALVTPDPEVDDAELATRIDEIEAFYHDRGQRSRFQITPASPIEVTYTLRGQGYTVDAPTIVCHALIDDLNPAERAASFSGTPDPSGPWADVFAESLKDPLQREKRLDIVRRAPAPKLCGQITHQGQVVSAGLAVADGDWVGLFGLSTRPEHRGQGLGKHLLDGLLDWGHEQGAQHAYLQVEIDNPRAFQLYKRLGFRELYRYFYLLEGTAP